jgi:hypothetical protein
MSDDGFEIEYEEEAVTVGYLHSKPVTFQITSMANDGTQQLHPVHTAEDNRAVLMNALSVGVL